MTSRDPNAEPEPTSPDALRVDLAALRRHGEDRRVVAVDLSVALLRGVLRDTDAEVIGPGQVALTLTVAPAGIVVVEGQLTLQIRVPCGRCLASADVDGSAKLLATYLPAATAAARAAVAGASGEDDEDGVALEEEDLDTWSYEGSTLPLFPLVTEQIRLAYPMRALCERGEDCRGLCSNCGSALNGLAPATLVCPQCKSPVPATPAADPAERGVSAKMPVESEKVASLAAALKKAGLDPSS